MPLPTTTKAAVYEQPSDDVSGIEVKEVPIAPLKANQVLVKTSYTSINPIDWKVFGGHLKGAGWSLNLPFTMGYDIAGSVVAVGDNVTNVAVGDEVFGVNWGQGSHDPSVEGATVGGTFSEYATIASTMLSKRPENLPANVAAACALVSTTAHNALFTAIELTKGQKILILGGSGAVGIVAIQLAKLKGAWVATTASSRTSEFVNGLGPDKVIDYTKEKWVEDPELKGIDAVFDAIGETDGFVNAKQVLKEDGRFVSIASFDAGFDPTAHKPLKFASFLCLSNSSTVQDEIATLIVEGKLKVPVEEEFEFTTDGVRAAITKQKAAKTIGKNVIKF